MTQVCTRCGVEKPLADYGLQASRAPRRVCKACDHARIAANRRKKRVTDPEWAERQRVHGRDERRLSRYGLTQEAYDELLAAADGRCQSCGRPEVIQGRRLAVDHDHVTGEVRGLLCSLCNRALGMLQDDVDRVLALAAYLIEHQTKETIPA